MNPQFQNRISERVICSIDIMVGDTLTNHEARIVDLSTHGAQVYCDTPFEAGKTIHLDLNGEYAWATVAWSEVDRMGLKFVSPLNKNSGLGQRLQQLQEVRKPAASPIAVRVGGFGRRIAA